MPFREWLSAQLKEPSSSGSSKPFDTNSLIYEQDARSRDYSLNRMTSERNLRPNRHGSPDLMDSGVIARFLASIIPVAMSSAATPEPPDYFLIQSLAAEPSDGSRQVFGVPVVSSITTVTVAIDLDLLKEEHRHLLPPYEFVPIVIEKCGDYLQANGLHTPAIFRTPGNIARIQELVEAFKSAPHYGLSLSLAQYEVHDIARVFLLYFMILPEPVIPYDDFNAFLEPYQKYRPSHGRSKSTTYSADRKMAKDYDVLISCLKPANRSSLLYVLNMLSLFASKSNINRTTSGDLARIFQPGLLNCPAKHGELKAAKQIVQATDVIIFLIDWLRPPTILSTKSTDVASYVEPTASMDNSTFDDEASARLLHQGAIETGFVLDSDATTTKSTVQPSSADQTMGDAVSHLTPVQTHDNPMFSIIFPEAKSLVDFSRFVPNEDENETRPPLPRRPSSNSQTSVKISPNPVPQGSTELQIPPEITKRVESPMNEQPHISTTIDPASLENQEDTEEPSENSSLLPVWLDENKTEPESESIRAMSHTQNLDSMFQLHREGGQVFSEVEVAEVAQFLRKTSPSWVTIPRIYIVLRLIESLDVCDAIVNSGFSDYELPFSTRSVPKQLSAEAHQKFLATQNLVKTMTIDLERGAAGQHHHFDSNDPFPFDIRERLGDGGFGEVSRVISLRTNREFALKRVTRKAVSVGKGLAGLRSIIREIEILKTLTHRHIVQFVGSYTDQKFLGLLMTPVAELNFSDYLAQAKPAQYSSVRSFFGCLTAGLGYLHARKIRHKDITPRNILVNQGSVLLTDFGLARDFTDATGSISVGPANFLSPRYAAPEVLLMEQRNTKSDIWSLGIVFLEMIVVLKDWDNKRLDDFMVSNGVENKFVRNNRPGFEKLVVELQKDGSQADNIALEWVELMVSEQHIHRPSAAKLLETIVYSAEDGTSSGRFCGLCCRDEDESDSSDDPD